MFGQLKRLMASAWLWTSILSLLMSTTALAASGDLDPTFSGDGRVTTNVIPSNPGRSDQIWEVAIQSNGKIVAAGFSFKPSTTTSDFALARYNANGKLDTTFSTDGRLTTNFGGMDEAYDVALQSNGKIVVSGRVCHAPTTVGDCDVALARYNPDGTLDTTFSGDGKQKTDIGGGNNGSYGGLAIQSDGKIVVAGYMWKNSDQTYDFAIYRYMPTCPDDTHCLDTTFSGDGIVMNGSFGVNRQEFVSDLVIQSDGKIVVAGHTGDMNNNNNNFAIARLNPNGTLDNTFSGDGRQTTNFGANDFSSGLALQPNGKIVVVGTKYTDTPRAYFAVARYNTNGSLDTTFNGTGRKVFSVIANRDSTANSVLIQPDNKIIVQGPTNNGDFFNDFAMVRLNSNGSFDTAFSGDGRVTVHFGGNDNSTSLALQPSDGKYVLGGFTDAGTGPVHFAMARMLP